MKTDLLHKEYLLSLLCLLFFSVFFLPQKVVASVPASPRGPHYSCDLANGVVQLKWVQPNSATSYAFQLDANPRSWNGNCANPKAGDRCMSVVAPYIEVPITPLVKYDWWVHAINSDGYSVAMDGPDFVCEIPRPRLFHYSCSNNNTQVEITWQTWPANGNPDRYELRFDNEKNYWSGSCESPNSGDFCIQSQTSYITVPITPGEIYKTWVHSVQNNVWAEGVDSPRIQCGYPPTNTPLPTISEPQTQEYCTSTDGNDIYTQGSIAGTGPGCTGDLVEEFCLNGAISETYCGGENNLSCLADIINCPNGCENGACKPVESTVTMTPSPTTAEVLTPKPIEPTTNPGDCPRHPDGDANCDDDIDTDDFSCWKSEYLDENIQESCVRSADFDGIDGVALLDYVIWQIHFVGGQM